MLEQRAACRELNTVQLRMQATELAKSHNIDNCKGNPSWCYRFMKRKNLAIRQRTTIAQLPVVHVEKLKSFRTFVQKQIADHKIRNDNIIIMDQLPLTFDIPMNRSQTKWHQQRNHRHNWSREIQLHCRTSVYCQR